MFRIAFFSRALTMGVGLCVLLISTAAAQLTDPFTGSSPSADVKHQESVDLNVGDWGVAEQRGAATYTFPIDLPKGRNGMSPSLVLRYSSQGRLRGGLAAGWTLDMPGIRIDRNLGTEAQTFFSATLGAVAGRLVEVPDRLPYGGQAFRVDFDGSFTRFFRLIPGSNPSMPPGWVALTTDGVKHIFAEEPGASDGSHRWNVTQQIDPFGNTVRYFWSDVRVPGGGPIIDQGIDRIEYSANAIAGLSAHAKVEFAYAAPDMCSNSNIPIGAAPSALPPGKVEGSRRLTAIKVFVRDEPGAEWRQSKEVAFDYELRASVLHEPVLAPDPTGDDLPCTQNPIRYLTRINVKGFNTAGLQTSLPPVTFEYNNRLNTTGPTLPGRPDPLAERTIDVDGSGHFGTINGAVATNLDIDSDGIRDKVSVREENRVCTMVWQRGLLGGTFESQVRRAPLPTAPWYGDWKGLPGLPLLPSERCTLNGQVAYRERDILEGDVKLARGVVSYHFLDYTGDGRLDLLTNVWATVLHDTYVPGSASAAARRDASAALPALAPPGDPGPGQPDFAPMTPERTERRRNTWRMYRNAGDPSAIVFPADPNAVVATNPMKIVSPRPLSPSASDERLDTSVLQAVDYSIPPLTDIDGDGFLDVIDVTRDNNLLGNGDWTVYLGNGGPSFPDLGGAFVWKVPRFAFTTPGNGYDDETSNCGVQFVRRRRTVAGLHDIDANGLPDLVVQTADLRMKVFRNTGAGFQTTPIDLGLPQPLERSQTDCLVPDSTHLKDGNRGFLQRLIDLDGDDRVDVLSFSGADDITGAHMVFARFNMGDRFGPLVQLPSEWLAGKRLLGATGGAWHLLTEFAEVNGDGMVDLVRWNDNGTATYIASPGLPPAPDLLRAVENGRGKRVEFRYAPTTDPAVVQWTTLTLGGPHMPSVQWVVESATVEGGFASLPLVTRYTYRNPQYLAPEHHGVPERSHFAGFGEATKTIEREGGIAARRVRREFAYDDSGSPEGVPVREWVYLEEAGALRLHTFEHTRWIRTPLFSGEVSFVHRLETVLRTCEPGFTEGACASQATNMMRMRETWRAVMGGEVTPLPPTRPAELYVHAATVRGSALTPREGDRRTGTSYQVRYGQDGFAPDDYRVLTRGTRLMEGFAEAGDIVFHVRGQTTHSLNAAGLAERTDVFHDEATIATTKRTFEVTGNQLTETRPVQAAPGGTGKSRTFEYDAHRLFPASITNELGHQVHSRHDLATGVLLERSGPNVKMLPSGESVFERETWHIDGVGRVVEHAITIDDEGAGYVPHVIEQIDYFDGELPNRVRTRRLRDIGGDVWLTENAIIDGLGRLFSTSVPLASGRVAVTAHEYDSLGNLVSTTAPDPRSDDTFVQYEYRYDGLNRLTDFLRPDGSGVAVSYAALTRTTREITSDGSGSTKKQVFDAFDRLREVRELEGTADAGVTRYRYDAADNLIEVVDADGGATVLAHDWVGHRVGITRGSRTWQYAYDLNGNLLEEKRPHPPGVNPASTATRFQYDDLDRVRTVEFTDSEGVQTIRHDYDRGVNGTGRLVDVELPFGRIRHGYDARGLMSSEERHLKLGSLGFQATQSVQREYNALGLLTRSSWDDGQQWRMTYDERGFVASVEVLRSGSQAWQQVASYERSIAGQPRRRIGSFKQTQNFSYDAMGRPVADTVVRSVDDGSPIATRSYTYTDSGDLATVTGINNGVPVDASFGYDGLHRLRTADGPNGYRGSFSYSPAGNILTAQVSWKDSPHNRHVRYEYGSLDRQAVERIVNVEDGGEYAAFAYDTMGNVVQRRTQDGILTIDWDGRGSIRHVDGPNGAETYYYDHTGARALAVSEHEGVRAWFAESETNFDNQGQQVRRYLHVSGGGPALARVSDDGTLELQYADSLQNLMLSLDASGQVKASFVYGPFGEVVHAVGEDDHRRQFNGKEHDAVSGLRYYGLRYYDPVSLRWTSADPMYRFLPDVGLSDPQRLNLYSFSLNNPVRYYDPDGADPKKEPEPCKTPKAEGDCDDSEKTEDESESENEDQRIRKQIESCRTQACVDSILIDQLRATCPDCRIQVTERDNGDIELKLFGPAKDAYRRLQFRYGAEIGASVTARLSKPPSRPTPTMKKPSGKEIPWEKYQQRQEAIRQSYQHLRGSFLASAFTWAAYASGKSYETQAAAGTVGEIITGGFTFKFQTPDPDLAQWDYNPVPQGKLRQVGGIPGSAPGNR
jgi:RHS repeat-associated protein